MENKENKRNGFLITWVSCILLLLVLCFFGVSDSMKVTHAAYTCPDGYPNLSGTRCYKVVDAKASPKYSATGSCSCKGSTSTASGSCSCTNSGGQYKGGTCTTSGCSCPSGYPTVSSNYCKTTPNTWSGTCDASSGSAKCLCGSGSVTSNSCGVTSSTTYSCSEGTLVDNKCHIYVDAIKKEDANCTHNDDPGDEYDCEFIASGDCWSCTKKNTSSSSSSKPSSSSQPSCVTKHPGIDYTCDYYYSGSTMCYDCVKKSQSDANYNANSEEEALTKCKNDNGRDCDCVYLAENVGGTGAYYCIPENIIGDKPVSGAQYQCYLDKSTSKYIYGAFTGGNYHVVDDKYCGIYTGDKAAVCEASGGSLSPQTGKSCSYYYFGNDNSVCWYDCKKNMCAEGTHATVDEFGNVVCAPDCTCDDTGCSEEEKKENSFCWLCNGQYSWGLESDNKDCKLTYITSESSCKGNYSPTPIPSPTSSKPSSSSSKPSSSSSSSNDRGEGCYKNKDTGEYKWLEKDPEVNSQNKLYEKVDDSKCDSIPESSSSVPKPSSSENITVNPQTGEIAMFLIWILGFGAAGYSVWYYIKSRKEN